MDIRLSSTLRVVGAFALLVASVATFALEPDQMTATSLRNARPLHARIQASGAAATLAAAGLRTAASDAPVPGIDSLVNFTGSCQTYGVDSNGVPTSTWTYAMVGQSPRHEAGAVLRAPLIPVVVDLRDSAGKARSVNGHPLVSDASQYMRPVLDSPIFRPYSDSSSSEPTQYTDAVQRAEFWGHLSDDWHTLLKPKADAARTMTLLQDPRVWHDRERCGRPLQLPIQPEHRRDLLLLHPRG